MDVRTLCLVKAEQKECRNKHYHKDNIKIPCSNEYDDNVMTEMRAFKVLSAVSHQ